MKIQFRSLIGAFVLLAASTAFASKAVAQTRFNEEPRPIPETFDRAFYGLSGSIHFQTSLTGQLLRFAILYPDKQIARSGKRVEELYRELMMEQTMSDPTIRTADLNNPFNGSLLTTPPSN